MAKQKSGLGCSAGNVPKILPEDISLCLYRVTQEALQNIWIHAASNKVDVTVKTSNEGVQLTVEDFGNGLDMESVKASGGLGLISMQERVRLVGGSIDPKSKEHGGAVVEVLIPQRKADDEPPTSAAGR